MNCLRHNYRKRIEITFSGLTDLMPKAPHCLTTKGFLLKTLLFRMTYQFDKVMAETWVSIPLFVENAVDGSRLKTTRKKAAEANVFKAAEKDKIPPLG